MAEKKKMSVAEILAAARKTDNKGGAADPVSTPPAGGGDAPEAIAAETTPSSGEASAPDKPAKAPAAKPKPAAGGRPSVAEMMALARAGKSGAAPTETKSTPKADSPKPEKPVKAAGAAKPAAAPQAEKPAAASGGPAVRETSSILAAARAANKPGPMSKSEAAARLTPDSSKGAPVKGAAVKGVVPPMPTKPDAARPKAAKSAPASEDRRWFVGIFLGSFLAVGFTSLAATLSLWTLGFARFMFPNILTEPPSKFKVGFPSDFPPGNVEEKFKAQFGVWVVNAEYQGQPQIYALKTVCTHLGCTPNWLDGEQKFKCPCHGSGFYKDGINFEGPAPRPLERYAIRLADDGQLEIDKSKLFLEEKGEWSKADCFVPA